VIGANNEVLFDGTYTYTYDAAGNCTAKFIDANHTGVLQSGDTEITQYTWDAGGRLVQVTTSATYSSAVTQTVAYLYDAEGRWIGENIANGSGVVTHETRFVYNGSQIVLQFDADSPLPSGEGQGEGFAMTTANLSHRYLLGPGVDQLLSDEQLSPLPPGEGQGEGGQDYNVSAPGTVVWALTDNVGTVRDLAICDLTRGTTSVVDHMDYSSFGQLLSQMNPATGSAATVVCVFGFTGRPFDTKTGVQNNLNRWYDPGLGRWISEDPTGFTAADTNEYRYVGNSPEDAVDPRGLWPITQVFTADNHEWMTIYAAEHAGYAAYTLDTEHGFRKTAFGKGLCEGVEWTDAPEGIDGLWGLEDYELGITSLEHLRQKYPQTYETQLGTLVYRHGMAPHNTDDSLLTEEAQVLKNMIVSWVVNQYVTAQSLPANSEAQGEAIGRALHTIEDLYSPAHTVRTGGTGAIELFEDYNAQDHTKHEEGDNRNHNDLTRKCYEKALNTAAMLLTLLKNGASATEVRDWLEGPNGPLVLAPNAKVGGTAPEYALNTPPPPPPPPPFFPPPEFFHPPSGSLFSLCIV